jgi:hypothetical protein
MARVKKAEREAVMAALIHPQDISDIEDEDILEDLKSAAERAIQALTQARMQHTSKAANRPWVVLMQQKGQPLVHTYGPYDTQAQAHKALYELACPGPQPCHSQVQKLYEVPS